MQKEIPHQFLYSNRNPKKTPYDLLFLPSLTQTQTGSNSNV